jgi:uncharacterized protein (DUF1810 family)
VSDTLRQVVTSTSTPFDLGRFKLAQDRDGSFSTAMAELRAGRKTSHWIWWAFPSTAPCATSPDAAARFERGGQPQRTTAWWRHVVGS